MVASFVDSLEADCYETRITVSLDPYKANLSLTSELRFPTACHTVKLYTNSETRHGEIPRRGATQVTTPFYRVSLFQSLGRNDLDNGKLERRNVGLHQGYLSKNDIKRTLVNRVIIERQENRLRQ